MTSYNFLRSKWIFTKATCFKAYLFFLAAPLIIYHSMAARDYWAILFIACLALYAPHLWSACILFLCYKTWAYVQSKHIIAKDNIQSIVVQSVQLNHLQKLTETLEANPEILYCDYQRRSLIAWCRYYQNTRAQELVMQMMKKYPKEAIAA